MTYSSKEDENLAKVHAGKEEDDDEGRNSKLREVNQVDHIQEMKEIAAKTGSSSSAPIVSGPSLSPLHHLPGLRSSLRNKNLDPKLKALSKKGEVNVAFSSDP